MKIAKKIVVVDHNALVFMAWEMAHDAGEILSFSSPEGLLDALHEKAELKKLVRYVVTNFHFDSASSMSGIELALNLKPILNCPVFLSANATLHGDDVPAHVALVVSKDVSLAVSEIEKFGPSKSEQTNKSSRC